MIMTKKTKKYYGVVSVILICALLFNIFLPAITVAGAEEVVGEENAVNNGFSVNGIQDTNAQHIPITVYDDESILIYCYEQLQLIGSGNTLTDSDSISDKVGTGAVVTDSDGKTVCYDNNRNYCIMQDIVLPKHTLWQIPRNFSGRIRGMWAGKNKPLYNSENDSIYLYNVSQLNVLSEKDREQKSVLTGDIKVQTFGTGDTITAGTDGKAILTYSDNHNYVISEQFDSRSIRQVFTKQKKNTAEIVGAAAWDGTSVYKYGVIYIANYYQLALIGTDTDVTDTDTTDTTDNQIGHGNKITLSGSGTDQDPYVYLKYSNDAVYYLTQDIPLPSRTAWTLPDGFTGYFTSAAANGEENSVICTSDTPDTRLYEEEGETKKVYYHNVFQMAEADGADIKEKDYDVLNYHTGNSTGYTYAGSHQYYIASDFTAKTEFDVTEYKLITEEHGYETAAIVISDYSHLALVGAGERVLETDTINGIIRKKKVNYPLNAIYYLENDILLPSRRAWTVPNGFVGYFTSQAANGKDNYTIYNSDTRLYDSGKVYYHNVFPIAENAGASIHNDDYDAFNYGTGELLYGRYYSNSHNYYLASNFTAKTEFDVTEYIDTTDSQGNNVRAIVIRNYDQLKLIGLGKSVFQTDTVNGIERKQTVNYPPDAVYYLANDIPLADDGWQLPNDFSGSFTCDPTNAQSDSERLYQRKTLSTSNADVYIQNIYQLEMLGLADDIRSDEPVLNHDYDAAYFGAGSPIYLTSTSTDYLTYKKSGTFSNDYILSRTFSNERVEQVSATVMQSLANTSHIDGRDFFGQTTAEVGGKTYILIGDRQQLDAIGTDKYVYGPVYAVKQTKRWLINSWQTDESSITLVYPGDADLIADIATNLDGTTVQDFSESSLFNTTDYSSPGVGRTTGNSLSGYERTIYCASDGHGGYNVRATSKNANRGTQRYTQTANYIVFRDINMNKSDKTDKNGSTYETDVEWKPLMFSGTMYGDKSQSHNDVTTLWNRNKTQLNISTERKPVISNVYVVQNGKLQVNDYTGIGFFATITNQLNENNVGISGGTAEVKNLELHDVHVENNSTETEIDTSLLDEVIKFLGKRLGALVDVLLRVLSFGSAQTDLSTTLYNLLNARANDPSIFATGAFAGRVYGDAVVEDCCVTGDVEVSNVKDYTGGFVGYTEGMTEYSGLSRVLGGVVDVLSTILNALPGVGLGDLITILLGNALPLERLIPTNYIAPKLLNCAVEGLSGDVGKTTTSFNGGFVGDQVGTRIENCSVSDSEYHVKAKNYGGGFCGLERDAEIKGTLDGAGIDIIIQKIHPQSVLVDCSISDCDYDVTGESFLGGFIGAMTSSHAVDCCIDCSDNDLKVQSSKDYAGGFAGYSSVGWQSSLGKEENNENSLLGTVRQLVTGLLSTDKAAGQKLLTLMGVAPSSILGCQIDSQSLEVQAGTLSGTGAVLSEGSFAGGIVGKGEGLYLGKSDSQAYTELAKWNSGTLKETPTNKPVILNGLKSVRATKNYAGGIAGYMGSAAFQGLLNDVVGLGDFIGFTARDITVTGIDGGYTVKADNDDAGGGFGCAVGGEITNVKLEKLKNVEANNRAGGFVGVAGPGELAGTGGLTVNLLGLDRVLQVSNLLQIGQGMEVKINNSTVTGLESDGYTVEATGTPSNNNDVTKFKASGFIADSNSTQITNSHAYNLKSVTANARNGYAGGFIGTSTTGGLAEAANSDVASVKSLIQADGLLSAISYLIPEYTNCTVNYLNGGYADADLAGGFVADMESGTVDNSTLDNSKYIEGYNRPYAVYNIDHVTGRTYGGGFGGRLRSGALANAGGGISILGDSHLGLNIGIDNLLGVMNSYIPIVRYADVYAKNGFTVIANEIRSDDLNSGSAGGFAGYASGAQISHSDVHSLKHTYVKPPKYLEDNDAGEVLSYFNGDSQYAVTGGHHAGGYVGNMDIGSAASVGKGLKVLGETIALTNVLSALQVVVTTIEHSDVYGMPGGMAILADGTDPDDGKVGKSGGFAGNIYGGHIQNSHCKNFSYIIGQEMAGGYVGNMEPGNVAEILGDGSILGSLIDVDEALASLVEDFVPTIRNSTTTCIPCGGAVRADSPSDAQHLRGCAGGYCGHNEGGHIWGYNNKTWKDQNDGGTNPLDNNQPYTVYNPDTHQWEVNKTVGKYTGPQHECKAERIRSVYGYEYAGGFTGFMESADTADTGSIKLLGNLLKLDNILTALEVVYPTEENTAVYGPLRNLDIATWNAWVKYVGKYGGYGRELAKTGTVSTQEELEEKIKKYVYGYNVVAGRTDSAYDNNRITEGGNAGGYVGYMVTGVITNGQAYDTQSVRSMRSAGGFAGRMQTGAAAKFGSFDLLGLKANLGKLIQAVQVFVPTIKSSSVTGYQSGMTVTATGTDYNRRCGYAGGYAGSVYGGQIWGDKAVVVQNKTVTGCNVAKLRRVKGTNAVGGYVGLATAASVADASTNDISKGFLQGILNDLISSPTQLVQVLQATVTTIRQAEISPDDAQWGYSIERYGNEIPRFAGGFAGSLEASVIGSRKGESVITVNGLRNVEGKYYAGGFFGLADVGSVASVSSEGSSGQESVKILNLIKLGSVELLDIFRTYIYYSGVNGVGEGIIVKTSETGSEGILSETRYTGCSGGFGGGIMNGSVKHSSVSNLNTVTAPNYAGGFIGHMGKNGAVDVNNANIPLLAGITAGVLDIFGAVVDECTVAGIYYGAVIISQSGQQPITGGFAGYADVSQIKNSRVSKLKQVSGNEIAGGFVGKTNMNYLIQLEASSPLVQVVLDLLNTLLRLLYVKGLENLDLINADSTLLGLKLLSDGDLLYVNLLGLKVGVSLVKADPNDPNATTDTAFITIGDSSVALPCSENGIDWNDQNTEVAVNLIKGNRTKAEKCSVTGINIGYDVYGGGATNDSDGSSNSGCAGGFVGFNNEGKFTDCTMIYCDVIRGTEQKTGIFSGYTSLQSVYSFNSLQSIEGENNEYSVYRVADSSLKYALTENHVQIGNTAIQDTATGKTYNRYVVKYLTTPITPAQNAPYYTIFAKWKNAVMASDMSGTNERAIDVYISSAKAVLMDDTPTKPNKDSLTPESLPTQDPCEEKADLKIHKLWNDMNNADGIRPSGIRVRILQHWYKPNGDPVLDESDPEHPTPKVVVYEVSGADENGWFTISAAQHGSVNSAVWEYIEENVPVVVTITDPLTQEKQVVRYYSYTVEEKAVDDYLTEISCDESGFEISITNTHHPLLLPITGASEGMLFVVVGVVGILTAAVFFRRRRTAKKGRVHSL